MPRTISTIRRRETWELPEVATRLLLASAVESVLPAVADIARAVGLSVYRAEGLLDLTDERDGVGVELLFDRLSRELTTAEAEVVRVAADPPGEYTALVTRLLTAPTLAVELARRGVTAEVGVLAEAELWSVYQPIVSLHDGAVVAHEALLRGLADGREIGGGDLFFVAESADWLPRLDRIGRECAVSGAAPWLGDADLFVNTHPTSVHRPHADLESTRRLLADAGLAPGRLVIEVAEPSAVAQHGHLLSVLERYRELGWRVALDDVAAGWGSRELLATLRPDVVKLGKPLVHALPDEGARTMVRWVVDAAHRVGAQVVAEGVEDERIAEEVAGLGADLGQGWFFGRPQVLEPEVERGELTAPSR
ncbi:EAL domain-containing protein [Trujillonella endophytica]|uniref:EAL domain, c-di-GMP-specific phosphodiesterase class I (Or its enzymatically inactive variant) n=1 Tax=Trujillonella endophytica TaxID=673521 RepID=A0A1H8US75_9ACTN|nr:EAL domain-containing protein [Trujillella endophytica]SEP05754.1 EAL domain, c-di-GMP-specific phosphodiesterase class I (or its enzymatically inactive variant) [Trujillella endophytica]